MVFNFKQFKIQHEQSFKVGTDGVLLGTWVAVSNKKSILDIGSGSGLIPLVLAQRAKHAKIIGVEIDEASFQESSQNVSKSAWADRVTLFHETIQAYSEKNDQKFDLIVSNPPYFINSTKSPKSKKNIARHTDKLPFSDLVRVSLKHLTPEGRFALVLPKDEGKIFIQLAKEHGLFLIRLTEVRSKKDKPIERFLMEFSLIARDLEKNELIIQFEKRNDYTPDYIKLTKDFYTIF